MPYPKPINYSEPIQRRCLVDFFPLRKFTSHAPTPRMMVRNFSNNSKSKQVHSGVMESMNHLNIFQPNAQNSDTQKLFKKLYESIEKTSISRNPLTERTPNIVVKQDVLCDDFEENCNKPNEEGEIGVLKKLENKCTKILNMTRHYKALKAHISNSRKVIGLPPIRNIDLVEKENISPQDADGVTAYRQPSNGRGQYHPRVLNPFRKANVLSSKEGKMTKRSLNRLVV